MVTFQAMGREIGGQHRRPGGGGKREGFEGANPGWFPESAFMDLRVAGKNEGPTCGSVKKRFRSQEARLDPSLRVGPVESTG